MTHTSGCSSASGYIEQIKRNEGRTSLKVADKWFITFTPCEVQQGDKVDLTYVVREKGDRTYRNIRTVELATSTPTNNVAIDKGDAINRTVALNCATQWAGSVDVVRVLVVADAFYGWLQGDPVQPGDYEDGNNEDVPF